MTSLKTSNSERPYLSFLSEFEGKRLAFQKLSAEKIERKLRAANDDPTSGLFFKLARDRHQHKFGGDITDEFRTQKAIGKVVPESTPIAFEIIRDKNGTALAYASVRVHGTNLETLLKEGRVTAAMAASVEGQLRAFVSKTHAAGISHGDIPRNIMVGQHGDDFAISVVDPVGYRAMGKELVELVGDVDTDAVNALCTEMKAKATPGR